MLLNLCSPALIYFCFSFVQIIIDITRGDYDIALAKSFVSVIFTILLNILCNRGLALISWIIVFIPFVLTTILTSILIYVYYTLKNKT